MGAQIERMMREAEKYAEQDRKLKERIDAQQAFESYLRSMRASVQGAPGAPGIGEKLSSEDKNAILAAVSDGERWLRQSPTAEADEIHEKRREVEGVCAPLVSGVYGGPGGDS